MAVLLILLWQVERFEDNQHIAKIISADVMFWLEDGQVVSESSVLYPFEHIIWIGLIPGINALNFLLYGNGNTLKLWQLGLGFLLTQGATLFATLIFLPFVLTIVMPYALLIFLTIGTTA